MRLLNKLRGNNFLKHNLIFFLGSVLVGVLNYAYYPVLGRLMPPGAFGEIQVLVSLFLQFTIFLNVLSLIAVNITVNRKDKAEAHRLIFELEKAGVYVALVLLLISIISGEFLRSSLHFDSQLPFTALALAMLVSIPLTFRSSYARGQKRFGIASMSQLIGAFVKILFSAGLVVLGLGVTGAIFGIVVAQLVAFLYAARYATRIGFSRPSDTHYGTLPNLKLIMPEIKYAGAVLIGLLAISLMMSVDVIVVKYYFDPHTAGLYAGIATVARTAFFLAAPIAQVLMPLVKIEMSDKQNRLLLIKSAVLTSAVCGTALLVCWVAPEFIIKILMGVEYITYAPLLPPLMLAVFIVSIINLIFMYYLALRQKSIAIVGIIGFVITFGMMLVWHDSLHAIVHSMLAGSIFTLGATGIFVIVNHKRGVSLAKQNDFDRRADL